jgi:hypothetical protein
VDSQKTPPAGKQAALVDLRLQGIERQVEQVLADMPESRLEAQKLIGDVFGMAPPAEVLHGFTQLAESEDTPPVQVELERKLLVMRLLVDLEIHGLTSPGALDLQTLDGAAWRLPELVERVEAFRKTAVWDPPELGPSELNQLNKLRKSLMPEVQELQGFAAIIPQVADLLSRVRDRRTDDLPFFGAGDVTLFQGALAHDREERPNRMLLYAATLRRMIQEHLEAWSSIPAEDRAREAKTGVARRDHPVSLEALKRDMEAYQVLSKRMQTDQDTSRSSGQDALVQQLSAAQQGLFAIYLQLTAAVRNPSGDVAAEEDPEARARLLQQLEKAEQSSGQGGHEKEDALLDALTAMRDGRNRVAEVALPASAGSVQREKLRRRVLVGVAAVLAVVAVAVNVFLMSRGGRATPIEVRAGDFRSAMPLNTVTPVGVTMFSEMSRNEWKAMPTAERDQRLQQLGSLAQARGFQRVLLLDQDKKELARWSAKNGVRILTP